LRLIKVEVTEKMKNFVWSPSSLETFCGNADFKGGCGVRLYLSRFCGKTYDVYRKHFTFGTTAHEILEHYHVYDEKPPLEKMLDEWLPGLWIGSEYKKKFARKFGELVFQKLEANELVGLDDFDLPDDSELTYDELRAGFPQIDIIRYLEQGEAARWMFLGYDSAEDERVYRDTLKRVLTEYHARPYVKPISIEDSMDIVMNGVNIRGRIDRVDARTLRPGYIVVDYKTSKKMKTVEEMHKDFQMVCYHQAIKEKYKVDDSQLQVGLFYLKPEARVGKAYVPQPMQLQITEIKSKMIDNVARIVKYADDQVKSGMFHYIDSGAAWKCPYCDHYGMCGVDAGGVFL
jgi:hypothetical protein